MKFHEYVSERDMEILDEGVMDFIKKAVIKYGLPAAVISAIISGQGCTKQSCPDKRVQEKVIQDFKATAPNAAEFLPSKKGVMPDGDFTAPNVAEFLPNDSKPPEISNLPSNIKKVGNSYLVQTKVRFSKLNMANNNERLVNQAVSDLVKSMGGQATLKRMTKEIVNTKQDGNYYTGTVKLTFH